MHAITRPAGAVAVSLTLAACGEGSAPVHPAAATAAADPTQACLQLHDFQLHNHGQGIPAAFGRQLEAETRGTQLGTDITQWLQDLSVNPSQIPGNGPSARSSPIESYLEQALNDAAAVGTDCDAYGVRNTLGSEGNPAA